MAGSSRGPLIFIVVGALAAASAAGVYLLYLGPKKARAKAAAEVEELSERWRATRTCLVGDAPLSSDLGEAIYLRELTTRDAAASYRLCEDLLKDAGRLEGTRTHSEEIESAWDDYRKGRSQLAKALAYRNAKRIPGLERVRRHLATGTKAADDAYQALRAKVGLEADAVSGSPLASGGGKPISEALVGADFGQFQVENNRVFAIDIGAEPRRMAILGDQLSSIIELRRGVVVAAAPPPGWGVKFNDRGYFVVELGASSGETADPSEPTLLGKSTDETRVVGAIGTAGGERLIVVDESSASSELLAFHSPTAGAPFVKKRIPTPGQMIPTTDLNLPFSRLTVQSGGQTIEWSPDQLREPRRLAIEGLACFSERASWWLANQRLVYAAGGEQSPVLRSEDMPWQVTSCTDSQLLGASSAGSREELDIRLCSQSDCVVSTTLPLPLGADRRVLIAPKRGPVVITSLGPVVLLWATDKKGTGITPSAAINIGEASLEGLIEWNGELAAVIRRELDFELAAFE